MADDEIPTDDTNPTDVPRDENAVDDPGPNGTSVALGVTRDSS
jgi:hypothetical protein